MFSLAANPSSRITGSAAESPGDLIFGEKHSRPLNGNAATAAAGTPLAPTGPGWSLITSPNTSTTQSNVLYGGVTCASAADCWAVGRYYTGSAFQTLIEHWNGTSWSIVPSPNNGSAYINELTGVTCASASDCWAVGYYHNSPGKPQTLIEHWNGGSWSIVPSANTGPTRRNILRGVTCASASDCWAVGYSSATGGDQYRTLIEHWDGTSWSIVASPNASQNNYLFGGVTCAAASDCWTVGYYINASGVSQTLIEHWNGTSWSIVTSPNTTNGQSNYLIGGVTCVSTSGCWAVGYYWYYSDGSVYQTLIEHWNGTSWSIVASPNASATQDNGLSGVTCASAFDCWAVGGYYNGNSGYQTLVEKYAPTIPPLTSIVSRKVHGSAGTFDVTLPYAGDPGIECRIPGATGTPGVDYKIVFSFVNNLDGCGTASTGSLSLGPDSNQCTLDLTGVANQQYLTITLDNVLDTQNNTGNVPATMGVLIGDTNASLRTDAGDVTLVRQQTPSTPASLPTWDFRRDVNASGRIDAGDVTLVRQHTPSAIGP